MAIQSAAGSKFYISAAAPATYNAAGFSALTWTEVGEVTEIGEFGKTVNVITHTALSDKKVRKLKGSYDNGTLSLPMALDTSDAGQDLCMAAVDSDDAYSIKIEVQDSTIFYTTGLFSKFTRTVGSVDTVVMANVEAALDGDIIED